MTSRNWHFGREDSFKLHHNGILGDRTLLGTATSGLACEELLEIGAELGMPACYRSLVVEQYPNANTVLFGLEDRDDGGVFKIYLEFWEQLRTRVRATGSMEPALLNLGVKWDTRTGAHCRTDYVCFPLLSVGDILGRLERLYRDHPAQPSHDFRLTAFEKSREPASPPKPVRSPRHKLDVIDFFPDC